MRIKLTVVLLGLINAATTCQKDYLDTAQEKFDRGYWEEAYEQYDKAKDRETDPKLVAMAIERKDYCANKVSEKYVQIARDHMLTRKYEEAIAAAEKARSYKITAENTEILMQAKGGKALQLYIQGRSQFELGEYERAVTLAESAIALDPKPEYTTLLLDIRRRQRETAAAAVSTAEDAFAKRQWRAAARAYDVLVQRSADEEARRRKEFAALMEDAEGRLESDRAGALSRLTDARRAGYHSEYVARLIEDSTAADYEVSFLEAVLLPFKPDSHLPWDGTGSAVPGAADLLTTLSRLGGDAEAVLVRARERIVKMAPEGGAAPDAYLKVTGFGQNVESPVRSDEYAPSLGAMVKLKQVTRREKAELTIEVSDKDDKQSESIGSYRIPLGTLVAKEGKQVMIFLDGDKSLRFGGVYGMTVSVRKTSR